MDEQAGLPELVLDGEAFHDLAGFFATVTQALSLTRWGRNLDAFNDVLRGGFGAPEGGFVLRWTHSATSAQNLGWPETVRWLEETLTTCHPDNVPQLQAKLAAAHNGKGQTLFDLIVTIIRTHGPTGPEAPDNVHLILA